MPISMNCHCGKRLKAREALAGKRCRCPACGNEVTVPLETPVEQLTSKDAPPRRTTGNPVLIITASTPVTPEQTGGEYSVTTQQRRLTFACCPKCERALTTVKKYGVPTDSQICHQCDV